MTTVEAEPIEHTEHEEHNDEEQRICHLYKSQIFDLPKVTVCGMPIEKDWHSHAHPDRNPHIWEKGQMACPICGAPVCMDCLLKVS